MFNKSELLDLFIDLIRKNKELDISGMDILQEIAATLEAMGYITALRDFSNNTVIIRWMEEHQRKAKSPQNQPVRA